MKCRMIVRSAPDVEQLTYRNTGKSRTEEDTTAGNPGDAIRLQGNPQGNNGAYYGNPQMNNGMPYGQPYVDPKGSFTIDGKDIADHKLFTMLPYLLGIYRNHQ